MLIETCLTCNITLTSKNAYKRGSNKDKRELQSYCKKCWNNMCSQRWIQRKINAIESMGSKCADCNESYPYQAMSFHHSDPSKKDFSWNQLKKRSQTAINKELAKCALLCLNCHAIRHISLVREEGDDGLNEVVHGHISTYRSGCKCDKCTKVGESLTRAYKYKRSFEAPKRTM